MMFDVRLGESHQRRVCELLPARGGSKASQQGRPQATA